MRLGIIGGSGLYALESLSDGQWVEVDTPWGAASDALLLGHIGPTEVVFLPRHGRGHRLLPSEINARANIAALKAAGCTALLSLSAVGSFDAGLPPGSFAIVTQYIDRTVRGDRSFFGDGIAAHVAFGDPVCADLSRLAGEAGDTLGIAPRRGATYVAIEGPQFSTRAESQAFRTMGAQVVGMTNLPEARLAREAELCYASVAMVTDYDSWQDNREGVDVAAIVQVMNANAESARRLVARVAEHFGEHRCTQGCARALDHAVITAREHWPQRTRARLMGVAGRVLA